VRRLEAQQGQYLAHRDTGPQLAIVDARHVVQDALTGGLLV
jgi:hypothetical protein